MTKQCFGAAKVPLSHAVRAGDYIYVSGQVPVDGDFNIIGEDVGAQTRKVLENVRDALALAGAEMSDVVKTTCWLRHAEDFAAFNAAYGEFFPKDPPARSTTEARLMIDVLVEIEAVAYKPA